MKAGQKPPPFEEERPYRSIFDAATDGLISTDMDTGLVIQANPAACAMRGCTRAEFIGLLPAAFIHPDCQNVFRNYIQAFRSGALFDTRVLHLRRDGATFHAKWRGTAFTYQNRPYLLGVEQDISIRIRYTDRLQQ